MSKPRKSHTRLRILALGLVIGVTSMACAKSRWVSELDLEPKLRSAALVMVVRVDDVSEVDVVYGGKGSQTLYQYTFKPIRVLKGVYSRAQLLLTSTDLRAYTNNFDPKGFQPGQQRLILLGRSAVGYIGIQAGATPELAFPLLSSRTDPLLGAVEVLLAQQQLRDRVEIASRLSRHLRDAKGRGAIVLLAALDRRSTIAAQQDLAFQAIGHQLATGEAMVREAAAHVLGNLIESDYLNNQDNRRAAVVNLVASLGRTETSLAARVAAFKALGSAVEAVRENEDALRLIALKSPYDTLAELSARLEVLGRLYEDAVPTSAFWNLHAELPLDAPGYLQQSATQSMRRVSHGADRLLERIHRKKALGLGGDVEVEAFALILAKASDPWPLQRTLLKIGLNTSEQEAFVGACEGAPSPELVPALTGMLDPRHNRLRRLAADLLMAIDTKAAARAIRPHLSEEIDLGYKLRLSAFIGSHGFDDGYPYALEHMSESRYREAAVQVLATINKPGTVKRLLDIYKTSNDLAWKRAAIRALGLLGHTDFLGELMVLTRDLAHPLAPSAILARADMGDANVMELLPVALSSRNDSVAIAAARAATRVLPKGQTGVEILTGLATLAQAPESSRTVRRRALEALVSSEDPRLRDVLITMIGDVQIERTDLLTRVRELLRELNVRLDRRHPENSIVAPVVHGSVVKDAADNFLDR